MPLHLLCRNRVQDFDRWKSVFDSHAEAHRAAGLLLVHLWRDESNANDVFFLFEIADVEKAKAFIADPKAANAGRASGVIEGEYRFLRTAPAYPA